MKKKGRGIYIAAAIVGVLGLLAAGRVFAGGGGGGGGQAIDTTGDTQGITQPSQAATQSAKPTQKPSQAPKTQATPKPNDKMLTISVNGRRVTIEQGPAILLNPGLVREGSKVAANGFGFDPGASLDLVVKKEASDQGIAVGSVKTDQNGTFGASLSLPAAVSSGSFIVVATQRTGDKSAQVTGTVMPGVGSVKLSPEVGKPGDLATVSLRGFAPGEDIGVYFNGLAGDPVDMLRADSAGNVAKAQFHVPVGAVGGNVFLFTGAKSQTLATAQFFLLALYPTLDLGNYAPRAASVMALAGKGFAPNEQVLLYLNSGTGQPIGMVPAGSDGSFSGVHFTVPFKLKGSQTLIAIGNESRAAVSAAFQILPFSPDVQPSTYGGRPGTSLSFYANGFGPNEVVLVYVGRTQNAAGKLVTAFRVDPKGSASAAGDYVIPGDAQGKLTFTLVGRESEGVATAVVSVQASDQPVNLPPQPDYVLPPDLQNDSTSLPTTSASPAPATSTPGKSAPAASPSASGSPTALGPYSSTAARVPNQPATRQRSWWASTLEEVSKLWTAFTGIL